MKELWELFATFCKIGAFTFGGGYAMLPMIQQEIVDEKKWATEEEVIDYFAIGQCTPGVIAVNTATFIGYNRKGILGGVVATLGVITPSVIIIIIIAAFIRNFMHIQWVQHAFAGIRVAVTVLILNAIIKMWKTGVKNAAGMLLFGAALAAALVADVPTILILVIVILGGIGLQALYLGRRQGR